MKGLFGSPTPYDIDVEKATSDQNVTEQWGLILDVCDKAGKSSEDAKNYLRAVFRRLKHEDPHIALHAASLLDACVSNCGRTFHLEVASREFEKEYTKLLKKLHHQVQQKLKGSLKKWAENEFKTDPQLNLIPSLYSKLKESGVDFTEETPAKKPITLSKDPNVVQSQEEEDQIAKAIELSLKETSSSPKTTSLYPSNLGNASYSMATSEHNPPPVKEPRKVRALYDFEAAEDNELTFNSGEILFVTDDSDPNWWKGSNQRGEGLFPANFVTADLSLGPEQFSLGQAKESELKESVENKEIELEKVEIDELKIDRLLHLLHEADSTNPDSDSQEMLKLEREVNGMGPLIDMELEKVDRKHAQLTQLSTDLVDALQLYHSLMREPTYVQVNKNAYAFPPQAPIQPPPGLYNGTPPHSSGNPTQYVTPYNPSGPTGTDRTYIPPSGLPPHVILPPNMMPPMGNMHQPHSLPPMPNQPGLPNYGPGPNMQGAPTGYTAVSGAPQMNGNVAAVPPASYNSTPNTHIM